MQTSAEIAARRLARHLESQSSVEVEVTSRITPHGANAGKTPGFTSMVQSYIETARGQRFLESRGILSGKVVSRETHFGDRGNFADIIYDSADTGHQNHISLNKSFFMEGKGDRRQVPHPLLEFHVGKKPLHQALPDAQAQGVGRCLGRECDRFLFKRVRWFVTQDQVYSLDRETSIPLQVEAFRDDAARESGRPMWSWTAKSLDQVQGYWLPLHSSMVDYGQDGEVAYSRTFDVDRIKFNATYPEATFRPVFDAGVTIVDGATGDITRAPGQWLLPATQPASDGGAGQALQAVLPREWSSSLASGTLLLGALLVTVGVLAWWRSRRGARG